MAGDKKLSEKIYDLIIIGAGPAGLSAAIYAARYKLDSIVFGEIVGGMAAMAYKICNFPTYKEITGQKLVQKMKRQVEGLKIKIKSEKIKEISREKFFKVKTSDDIYFARKIILATGTKRKKLNLDNEDKFTGRGISYCATCDAGFYKDKNVSVVGGSDAALTSALLLSEFAKQVYIIYRQNNFFRAQPAWVELINKNKKIKSIFNANVIKLIGEEKLEAIQLDNKSILKIDGLFIEVGSIPETELLSGLGVELDNGYVLTDKEQKTNISGFFAAGDITDNPLKQIITAAAEGAVAADSAYKQIIQEKNGDIREY